MDFLFIFSVIYDPKAKDNEKQSADWAVKFINETIESLQVSVYTWQNENQNRYNIPTIYIAE